MSFLNFSSMLERYQRNSPCERFSIFQRESSLEMCCCGRRTHRGGYSLSLFGKTTGSILHFQPQCPRCAERGIPWELSEREIFHESARVYHEGWKLLYSWDRCEGGTGEVESKKRVRGLERSENGKRRKIPKTDRSRLSGLCDDEQAAVGGICRLAETKEEETYILKTAPDFKVDSSSCGCGEVVSKQLNETQEIWNEATLPLGSDRDGEELSHISISSDDESILCPDG